MNVGSAAMETFNYFNYFTEIEEYFWRKRGAHLLVSPLDWAILETWQHAAIPISAVQKGIDRAFESYQRSKRGQSGRQLKSLAYCVEAVMDAADEEKEAAAGAGPAVEHTESVKEQFSREELARHFARNSTALVEAAEKLVAQPELAAKFRDSAERLAAMLSLIEISGEPDLEDLERRLTIIEEKLVIAMAAAANDELLLGLARDLDRQLAPYRRKMTPGQLQDLERRYKQKRLFEQFRVPRLSLFYLK